MLLSYRARLRRDLARWQEGGIIDGAQAARIAAVSLRAPGLGHLQAALALCVVLLAAPSVIAFVAANWAGMAPLSRLLVLVLADAAAVLGAYLAARRNAATPSASARALADGAATLSLAIAAAAIALVAQTFHLPSDPRGFAGTVALLGLATALIGRSGGAALVACAALVAADSDLLGAGPLGLSSGGPGPHWQGFWIVGPALFVGCLCGWLPARSATLFLLLAALANHIGAAPISGYALFVGPDRIVLVAALGHGLGRLLSSRPGASQRLREGGEALAAASEGLFLIAILAVAVRTLGLRGSGPGLFTGLAFAGLVLAAIPAVRPRWTGRGPLMLADLVILGAAGLALASWLALAAIDPAARQGGSAFWTVCGGILPALGLVVAGHLDERRALFNGGLALTAGLTIGMLAVSRDLIGFSGYLFGCAILIALTLGFCRWAERRMSVRSA